MKFRPVPWWMWPNVTGLDVCAVALVWQELIARTSGVEVDWATRAALGLAILAIYFADKVGDARRLKSCNGSAQVRHVVATRHTTVFGWAFALAVICGIALTPFLPRSILAGGIALGTGIGVYFVWNHLAGQRFGRPVLKEAMVSMGFAMGTGLPVLVDANSIAAVASIGIFALVCFANSLMIAELERSLDKFRGETSIATAARGTRRLIAARPIAALSAIAALPLIATIPAVAAATIIAAALLFALNPRSSPRPNSPLPTLWPDLALLIGGGVGLLISF